MVFFVWDRVERDRTGKDRSAKTEKRVPVGLPLGIPVACIALCAFLPGAQAAFQDGREPGGEGIEARDTLASTITYPAAWFAAYAPVTALDMLNRIPGVESVLDSGSDSGRGLGAGSSPILIDGKRIAGKASAGSDVLERIAARQVSHVEIIRGAAADLDIRTDGLIVNIVMNEGASRSSMSAEVSGTSYAQTLQPGASLSFGGQQGDFNYLASFSATPKYERQELREYGHFSDGRRNQMKQVRQLEQTDYEFAGNFSYALSSRDLFQFNTLYLENQHPYELEREYNHFDGDQRRDVFQWEVQDTDRHKWELGGNYQHSFDDGDRFNLIFVLNESVSDWYYDRYQQRDSGDEHILYIGEDKATRERILRSSYSTGLWSGQDLEFGIEGAQTILDKQFRLGNPGTEASPRFNGLRPVSDVDSIVEETRFEPFVIHNWQLSPAASLESTLVAEFSEISQTGRSNNLPLKQARDFRFIKPKVDYRYNLSPNTQLRATLERYISQLSFDNFMASSDGDLDKNVNAGNPDLEQQKSWRYEVRVEHRLPEDVGVFNTRFFYHDIEDVIDRIDVSSADSLLSAPGNIGDGERYGLELDASLRLKALNMPDALLTLEALVQDSTVTDPFLHQERRISSEGRGDMSIGFRHDLPAWNMNYGADYKLYFQGGESIVDIEDVEYRYRPPETSLYVEKIAFGGVTFRLESSNLLDSESCYERRRYAGHISAGVIEEVEDYCYTYGHKVALTVKTTF